MTDHISNQQRLAELQSKASLTDAEFAELVALSWDSYYLI